MKHNGYRDKFKPLLIIAKMKASGHSIFTAAMIPLALNWYAFIRPMKLPANAPVRWILPNYCCARSKLCAIMPPCCNIIGSDLRMYWWTNFRTPIVFNMLGCDCWQAMPHKKARTYLWWAMMTNPFMAGAAQRLKTSSPFKKISPIRNWCVWNKITAPPPPSSMPPMH